MHDPFPHLRAAIAQTPWAILPERLSAICEVVERRCVGIRLTPDEIAARKGARLGHNGVAEMFAIEDAEFGTRDPGFSAARGDKAEGGGDMIAVINMMGIVAQHAAQVDDISGPGGTSTERLGKSFDAAFADPRVKAIVFNIDSPGGSVFGVQELADKIHAASKTGRKPVVAQVNSLSASAAYWLASACGEIVMTPSGQVGSIGVYSLHEDVSAAADKAGVKFTFVSAGRFKVEGNPYEPLAEEARGAIQKSVDDYYAAFVGTVARGRGVKASDVKDGFGEGRVVGAAEAKRMGMVDSVATLEETLRRFGASSSGPKAAAPSEPGPKAEPPSAPPPVAGDPDPDHDTDLRRRRARLRSLT